MFISHSMVSFLLDFTEHGNCQSANRFMEGIEFSIRLTSRPYEWIPLKYIYRDNNREEDDEGTIRGYMVDEIRNRNTGNGNSNRQENVAIDICNFCVSDSIQFRWLQTSDSTGNSRNFRDSWILDDIEINIVTAVNASMELLSENFDIDTLK